MDYILKENSDGSVVTVANVQAVLLEMMKDIDGSAGRITSLIFSPAEAPLARCATADSSRGMMMRTSS